MLRYSVTTGLMPLKSDTGQVEARIFFMAYTLERPGGPETRPLMFSFNGGPGSSSVWLHLGALGPKRVKMRTDGAMPSPPYRLVDNEHTWLDDTDLVFIDPVGTGYSRPAKPELGKKFWGVQGDIESVGEFIRLYLTRHERWGSPLFLVGESYGTTRAAGLAGHLVDRGIAFNGILLVSSILNFQTARFTRGNDLPYPLFLPTYAATAWYHKKLPADLQAKPVVEFLREVEAFAGSEYPGALQKGDRMTAGFADTSEALRSAFAKNPDMRVFVANGYYDLATPYFATAYTLSHMGLDEVQRARISTAYYEAGHMMYIHEGELAQLKQDVAKFIASALAKP